MPGAGRPVVVAGIVRALKNELAPLQTLEASTRIAFFLEAGLSFFPPSKRVRTRWSGGKNSAATAGMGRPA